VTTAICHILLAGASVTRIRHLKLAIRRDKQQAGKQNDLGSFCHSYDNERNQRTHYDYDGVYGKEMSRPLLGIMEKMAGVLGKQTLKRTTTLLFRLTYSGNVNIAPIMQG
jgi:hypothetical protein